MKKFLCMSFYFTVIVGSFFISNISYASTSIYSTTIGGDMVWGSSGSPYILNGDVRIATNATLYIEPGVEVQFGPYEFNVQGGIEAIGTELKPIIFSTSTEVNSDNIMYPFLDGQSDALGNVGYKKINFKYVNFNNLGQLNSYGRQINIENSNFNNTGLNLENDETYISDSNFQNGRIGISSVKSTTTISSSTIKNFNFSGIYYRKGILNIDHSYIVDNEKGIYLQSRVEMVKNFFRGILDQFLVKRVYADEIGTSTIQIHNSAIFDNHINAINEINKKDDAYSPDLSSVWWGNTSGPLNTISGEMITNPFLLEGPKPKGPESKVCCSNIIFLPGMEASRLYMKDGSGKENQLWEPNRNSDVQKLYLEINGRGGNSVYTKDVISSTNVVPKYSIPIYKSFIENMNNMVASGTIKSWEPHPYDWRLSLYDIYEGSNIFNRIVNLASTSKTHKVTIVAHSNGGLLAKYIMSRLEEISRDDLIDKIILVATPHWGTPQALASLLYGEGQDIAKGFILSKGNAVKFAQNLPVAYNLLPSSKYLVEYNKPSVSSSTSNLSPIELQNQVIADKNFILKNQASSTHTSLDDWQPKNNISVYQIVGEGLPTMETLVFNKKSIFGNDSYSFNKSLDGDGIVVLKSANGDFSSTTYSMSMNVENKVLGKNYSHANILEYPSVLNCVDNLVLSTTTYNSASCSKLKRISTLRAPSGSALDNNIPSSYLIGAHSPVSIYVEDGLGRKTGIVEYSTSTDDVQKIYSEIPNSQYEEIGEGKYVDVVDPDKDLKIKIDGQGVGTFSISINPDSTNPNSTSSVFEDIPVTPITEAYINLSKSTEINIDIDGNGTIDATSSINSIFDPILYIKTIKSLISNLPISPYIKKELINRLDKLEIKIASDLKKNKGKDIKNRVFRLIKTISIHKHGFKKVSQGEVDSILAILNDLLGGLDKI